MLQMSINQFMQVAATVIQNPEPQRKRPWISDTTLNMISHREYARIHGQYDIESKLHKQIKLSARADRKYWLESELVGAPWSAIKALRKLPIKKPV